MNNNRNPFEKPPASKPDANGWRNPHLRWRQWVRAHRVQLILIILGAGLLLAILLRVAELLVVLIRVR